MQDSEDNTIDTLVTCNSAPVTFSIITITYNNLQGLQNTAQSILKQTYMDYEWIVVDAASTDGTQDFLNTLDTDYISEPDTGIYDAMNKGIEKSTGDYLIFMNAGDIFAAPDILDMISENTQNHPDFIYGDSLETDENCNTHYKAARTYKQYLWGMFTHHQSMLYKRSLIQDLRYNTDYCIAADYDFTCAFLKKSDRIIYCPFPICIFEPGGISQQKTRQGRLEQFEIRKGYTHILMNYMIFYYQSVSSVIRQIFPKLYWAIKKS